MNPGIVVEADLRNPDHQAGIVSMTDRYSLDAMGNGMPLSEEVKRDLIPGLQSMPTAKIFLAYLDGKTVGIATCFLGFSTFTARPVLNIHDFSVAPASRGKGIGRMLMEAVEQKARALHCSKITLEVVENNDRAKHVYAAAGFKPAVGGIEKHDMLFYSKPLS
jgi:GNAT superfamily N-acetyltransferase